MNIPEREYFIGQALAGILACPGGSGEIEAVANRAIEIADAVMVKKSASKLVATGPESLNPLSCARCERITLLEILAVAEYEPAMGIQIQCKQCGQKVQSKGDTKQLVKRWNNFQLQIKHDKET